MKPRGHQPGVVPLCALVLHAGHGMGSPLDAQL